MTIATLAVVFIIFLGLTFVAWRRYLWAAGESARTERRTPAHTA